MDELFTGAVNSEVVAMDETTQGRHVDDSRTRRVFILGWSLIEEELGELSQGYAVDLETVPEIFVGGHFVVVPGHQLLKVQFISEFQVHFLEFLLHGISVPVSYSSRVYEDLEGGNLMKWSDFLNEIDICQVYCEIPKLLSGDLGDFSEFHLCFLVGLFAIRNYIDIETHSCECEGELFSDSHRPSSNKDPVFIVFIPVSYLDDSLII